jgi:hypothetical protein
MEQQPAPPEPTPRLNPNFDCVHGLLNGYHRGNNRPTPANIRALLRDLGGLLEYAAAKPDATWEEILALVQEFPKVFTTKYDDGHWPRD